MAAARTVLIGSHTDSVPKGGWLDGALGDLVRGRGGPLLPAPRREVLLRNAAGFAGPPARLDPSRHIAYLEAHVEQGPKLESAQKIPTSSVFAGQASRRLARRTMQAPRPARACMMVEFRDLDEALLERMAAASRDLASAAGRGPVAVELEQSARMEPASMDPRLAGVLAAASRAHGEEPLSLPSGAGHDIAEDTSEDDIVLGCRVLAAAVDRLLS
jgi:N-carbamoyl-L-amino-acid hydrolase